MRLTSLGYALPCLVVAVIVAVAVVAVILAVAVAVVVAVVVAAVAVVAVVDVRQGCCFVTVVNNSCRCC